MKEIRTYSTNTDINPEPYKPVFTLINPDAKEDYLLDGRYVVRAPKRGRWLKTGQSFIDPNRFRNYCCSECGYELDEAIRIKLNYCPNCGAKMDKE